MDTARTDSPSSPVEPRSLRATDVLRRPRPDAPPTIVLDVRREPACAASGRTIAGALRCPPEAVADAPGWLPPGVDVICACVHGHEVSRGAAATLRRLGVPARPLEDGIEGWIAAGGPTRRLDASIAPPPRGGSTWVTRARPKVDRIACPWLVRRFVDPLARVVYLPADEVLDFATRTGAIAFDLPGGTVTQDGERCSFDVLIDAAGLDDPALRRLADIVRGADTARPDLAPEAAGLLAASLGLSTLHPDDDTAMLNAGTTLYDALYAWSRDATRETHAWTPGSGR